MWTPIILMCTIFFTECSTYGGPVFTNRESCMNAIAKTGGPYVSMKFPDKVIMDATCINWDTIRA